MAEQDRGASRRILVGNDAKGSALIGASLWPMLALAGIALLAVGLSDLALAWYPPLFGNREWEFGTVTATLNGLPVVLMGAVFAYLGAANRGMVRTTRLIGVVSLLGALCIVAMAGLYLTNVPLALQSVEGPILLGVKKAIAKSLVQSVVYPITFGVLGVRALRHFRSATG
ncbi:MAG TPA: hypothetical protein VLA36_03055 [Longimicrobiales bacterium]|nr:hypothetical protein [Longimicrobiales bacterium]